MGPNVEGAAYRKGDATPNVEQLGGRLDRENRAASQAAQDHANEARRAVGEAIACGARFILTPRDFLWEPAPGANRSRIRKIIADAKASSAAQWRAFRTAIAEVVGAP